MKRLNVKLLIWIIVVSAVLLGAIVGLHGFQVSRNSKTYLKLAEQAEKQGQLPDAVSFYDQYLAYHPDDAKVQSRFALLLVDLAERPEATGALQFKALGSLKQALRLDPKNTEVRGRLARYLLRGGRVDDAVTELETLRQAEPANTEWEKLLAESRLRIGKHAEAVELLRSVVSKDPKDVRSYGQLAAILLRYVDDKEAAKQVLDDMVAANPDNWLAHLTHHDFQVINGQKEAAAEDLARALELGPDELEVRLTATRSAIDAKDYAQARTHLEHAASKHPKDFRIYQHLAGLARTEGKLPEAIAELERGLKELPESAELWEAMFQMRLAMRDLANAKLAINKLQELSVRPEYLDQYRAQILIQEGRFAQALRTLNALRPKVLNVPQMLIPVDMLRADCYGARSQSDLQIEAYRQILFLNPTYAPARRGLGEALYRSGQLTEAAEELSTLAASGDGAAALALLQVSIQQQLRLAPEQRNWSACDDIIKQLVEQIPDKRNMIALQIDYRARKGDFAGARELLLPLLEENPKDVALWLARIDLATEERGAAAGIEELKAAEAAVGAAGPLRQAQVNLYLRQGDEESKNALVKMADEVDQLPEAERAGVRQALANAFHLLGDYERAIQLLQAIAKANPNDLNARMNLFRLAREAGNDKMMQESLAEIKKLMGDDTFWQYGEAARIVAAVARNERPIADLKAASKLLDAPLAQRPKWGAPYSLLGEIEQRQGNIDEAILRYQRAFDLGDRSALTVRSLVVLMVIRNRAAEAEAIVNRIPRAREALGPRVMAMVDMMLNRQEEALDSATEAVKQAENDYSTQLWYGNVMLRHGKFREAEQAFLKAQTLAENVPDVWLALVNFYSMTQNIDAAKKAIAQAEARVPADQKDRTLATAYELIKEDDKAEHLYEESLKKSPDDLNLLRQFAQFELKRNKHQQSVDLLQQILERSKEAGAAADPHVRWARRTLAQMLASGGEFQHVRGAIAVLDGSTTQFPLDHQDRTLKADLLARLRDSKSRAEAIKLLSDNVAQDPTRVRDYVGLARLFNINGDWTSAKGTMLSAVKLSPKDGDLMLVFAEMLLQHRELTDAAEQLDKYEKEVQQKAPSYTSLRAQMAAIQDQPEQAIALARSLIAPPLPPDQIPQLKSVAAMLEGFARLASNPEPYYAAAGDLYREYVKEVPDDALVLADFLGRHGGIDEALQICDDSLAKGTPGRELVIRSALTFARNRAKELTDPQSQRVRDWIEAGIKEKPDEPTFYVLLADLNDLLGRFDESQKLYASLVANKKLVGNLKATVLNNLAYLLAVKDHKGKEAMPYIEEAIALVGPVSELLDTRAMVQLSLGENKAAVEDMKRSVGDGPSPLKLFHLAIALLKTEDEAGAADAFKQAVQMGLKADDLSTLERPQFDELKARFPTELSANN